MAIVLSQLLWFFYAHRLQQGHWRVAPLTFCVHTFCVCLAAVGDSGNTTAKRYKFNLFDFVVFRVRQLFLRTPNKGVSTVVG